MLDLKIMIKAEGQCNILSKCYITSKYYGGALSAMRAQCGRSATIWASSRTGDPYFVILGASLLPLHCCIGFDACSTWGIWHF